VRWQGQRRWAIRWLRSEPDRDSRGGGLKQCLRLPGITVNAWCHNGFLQGYGLVSNVDLSPNNRWAARLQAEKNVLSLPAAARRPDGLVTNLRAGCWH
jgi:hypothetical protein